ncbi:hypothetical protein THMIRHAM_21420 [Thiomicrorhabdus immobilis]|uniref:DUF3833 domain-containing protein n=1 Tax=Thiomicrorhabdus immobilis TaxID=2791037 RepID=A0ABM7MFR2_9GAMM|nr:DUF3833 domain-containing protein [Thiomicrorhabdus immobilis]BCN94357.1 hypothetical protein THMIRHAM_21420 [Thiomicrorhabdus immobilis]
MMLFKGLFLAMGLMSSTLISGCSSVKIQDYQNETPQLELFEYFKGKTFAQGQFQDRSGKVLRRFTVDINGTVDGQQLTLDERFVYHDGEKQQRVWQITQTAEGHYTGKADDVVGEAIGESAGNALNWRYTLDLPYKDGSIHVQFNDWMFLQSDSSMINRASVTKWGFNVGEVTLFFSKTPL